MARATEIEFKPGVVIEVDGDVEDSFLDNGDLLLQWKSGTGSLTLPGYAKAWVLEVGGGGGSSCRLGAGESRQETIVGATADLRT